jgi:hypothetical protein
MAMMGLSLKEISSSQPMDVNCICLQKQIHPIKIVTQKNLICHEIAEF